MLEKKGDKSFRDLAAQTTKLLVCTSPETPEGEALEEAAQALNEVVVPQLRTELDSAFSLGAQPWGRPMMNLQREIMALMLGLDVNIPSPSKEARSALDCFLKTGGDLSLNTLVYLPELDLRRKKLPSNFIRQTFDFHHLVRDQRPLDDLRVRAGWRLVDLRKYFNPSGKYDNGSYNDDEEFMTPLIQELIDKNKISSYYREIYAGVDAKLDKMNPSSRVGLYHYEVVDHVIPLMIKKLKLPDGTLSLPTLAEACLLYNLYQLPPVNQRSEWAADIREWDRVAYDIRRWSDSTISIEAKAVPSIATSNLIGFRLQGNFL